MSYDTRLYREFCLNIYGKQIEHNEIDFKNLTNSEQSQIMIDDSKFRKAYYECFNHESTECVWPEIITECIEEPEIFIDVNLMKLFITKLSIREANILTKRNQLLAQLKNYKENKGKIINIIPNFFKKVLGGKASKSYKEYEEDINHKIREVESSKDEKYLNKLDQECLKLNNRLFCAIGNLKDKKPSDSFLTNWKSKYTNRHSFYKNKAEYLEHTKASINEESKIDMDCYKNNEKISILDTRGLMFTKNHLFGKEHFKYFVINFISDLQTVFFNGPQVKTVDEIVELQQINFCGEDTDHYELEYKRQLS